MAVLIMFIVIEMPAKLPDSIKSLVIQQWLQGIPRNDIASENGLSAGAVTNIVNELRLLLDLLQQMS